MSGVIVRVSVIVCIQTFRSDLHRFDSHDVQSNASSQIRPRAHNERATQCKRERASVRGGRCVLLIKRLKAAAVVQLDGQVCPVLPTNNTKYVV